MPLTCIGLPGSYDQYPDDDGYGCNIGYTLLPPGTTPAHHWLDASIHNHISMSGKTSQQDYPNFWIMVRKEPYEMSKSNRKYPDSSKY